MCDNLALQKRHYTERHYAECHYGKCHYGKCRGALPNDSVKQNFAKIV